MLDLLITSLWFIGTSNLTMDHVPRGMSCYKVITVITKRVHCFHGYICIKPILLLCHLSTLCFVDHLQLLILQSLLRWLSTLWFIGPSKV